MVFNSVPMSLSLRWIIKASLLSIVINGIIQLLFPCFDNSYDVTVLFNAKVQFLFGTSQIWSYCAAMQNYM